jgi:hypothetical protein
MLHTGYRIFHACTHMGSAASSQQRRVPPPQSAHVRVLARKHCMACLTTLYCQSSKSVAVGRSGRIAKSSPSGYNSEDGVLVKSDPDLLQLPSAPRLTKPGPLQAVVVFPPLEAVIVTTPVASISNSQLPLDTINTTTLARETR